MTRITGTLREDQYAFMIISRSVLRMKNVSDKKLKRKSKEKFCVPFLFLNRAVYEMMFKNIV
jgi:hypothetical protein